MLCLCAALLKFWFQTDLGRENSASSYSQGRQLLLTFLIMATRWSRFTSNFYALIGQNVPGEFHTENLCSILKVVYFDSCMLLAKADRVLCQVEMFSTVFFHWMYKMKYSYYQESSHGYSWLVCLLGFWLRNASLVKVGNPISDGIVFVFHLAWCIRGLKNLKRFWHSRIVNLSNYYIWCLSFLYLISWSQA